MDNVLFIAQYFPPGNTVAARRFTRLGETGNNCFAIRREQAGDNWPAVAGVTTVSVVVRDLRSQFAGDRLSNHRKAGILRHFLPLRQAFPFLYLTDDGGLHYRRKAFRIACDLIERHGITTIFSSFRPWSDHLVARRLKRKYPHLRWIADFRDLPVDAVRKDIWWPALQTWWGKRVVRSADEMWAISEGQRVQFAGWHPKIEVVRNALMALPPETPPPVTERFTVVYTGSLYPDLQTMKPLVTALRNMLADGTIDPALLSVMYRGKDDSVFRQWSAELPVATLDIAPSVAPATAQKIQRNAQVLLLLNWSAPGYYGVLTAKLWDYLASGRPILALVKGPGDRELSDIILGANAGAVLGLEEQGEVETWLRAAYQRWSREGSLPWPVDRDRLKKHLPPKGGALRPHHRR